MSIMGMRRKFAKHLKIILWFIIIGFVLSVFLLAFYSGRYGDQRSQTAEKPEETIATVSGEPILRSQLDMMYRMLFQQQSASTGLFGMQGVSLTEIINIRFYALNEVASNRLIAQEARKRGFDVSKGEIRALVEQEAGNIIEDLKQSAIRDNRDPREIYRNYMAYQGVERSRITEDQFRKWLIDFLLESEQDYFKQTLIENKLKLSIINPIQVNDTDLMKSFDEAQMHQIVIMYPGATNRTEEEAKKLAEEAYAKLEEGTSFEKVSEEFSDLPQQEITPQSWTPKVRLGSIFGNEAEEAVFSLNPGEYTKPLKTQRAYIIVELLETRRQLPEDFTEKKAEYKKQLLAQRQEQEWNKFRTNLLDTMEIKSEVPEVQGLVALGKGDEEKTVAAFDATLKDSAGINGEFYSAIAYYLGNYYLNNKELEKAKERFDSALFPVGEMPHGLVIGYPEDVYLGLGKVALEQGNEQEALENFDRADSAAITNFLVHSQLQDLYQKMGQTEKAEEQKVWLEEYSKEQQRAMEQALEEQRAAEEAAKQQAAQEGSNKEQDLTVTPMPTN